MQSLPSVSSLTMVLYHARCPDGFGAAWAYWKALGDRAVYVPTSYGQQPPGVEGQHVVMVDVSFPRPVTERLARQAHSFSLIDHHSSAFDELGDLPFAHFDMSRSGASLAWMHAHPDVPVPLLIRCIEDRDVGRHAMEGADEVLHVLDALPCEFEAWDALSRRLESDWEGVWHEGAIMKRKFRALRDRLATHARPIEQNGYRGMAVNAPMEFASDLGMLLASSGDFGFTWYMDSEGKIHGSWRSAHLNVIPLAAHYGGGGHRSSSGARLTIAELTDLLAHMPATSDCQSSGSGASCGCGCGCS